MKVKLDSGGNLWIKRGTVFVRQECRNMEDVVNSTLHLGSEVKRATTAKVCNCNCSLFGEPKPIGGDVMELKLCRVVHECNTSDFSDERV